MVIWVSKKLRLCMTLCVERSISLLYQWINWIFLPVFCLTYVLFTHLNNKHYQSSTEHNHTIFRCCDGLRIWLLYIVSQGFCNRRLPAWAGSWPHRQQIEVHPWPIWMSGGRSKCSTRVGPAQRQNKVKKVNITGNRKKSWNIKEITKSCHMWHNLYHSRGPCLTIDWQRLNRFANKPGKFVFFVISINNWT